MREELFTIGNFGHHLSNNPEKEEKMKSECDQDLDR
jgi:hypothetical protein